jgi:hypothetical protein
MHEKILEELQFSVGVVLACQEVVPRFRILCHDGDWTVFVPLPDDLGERQRRMQLVYGFMVWMSAHAFVMSSELIEPDIVITAAISHTEVLCACRPIVRTPLSVGPIQWLTKESIGDEVLALLPRGRVRLDPDMQAALVRAFGSGGEFEARRC